MKKEMYAGGDEVGGGLKGQPALLTSGCLVLEWLTTHSLLNLHVAFIPVTSPLR